MDIFMKTINLLTIIIFIYPYSVNAAKLTLNNEPELCEIILNQYSKHLDTCSNNLSNCINNSINDLSKTLAPYKTKKISQNHYGYTSIDAANLIKSNLIWLQLNRYNGVRMPRILETWLVKENDLNKVLAIPPGPIKYQPGQEFDERRYAEVHQKSREINSEYLHELLNSATQISDQVLELYKWGNRDIFINNIYKGNWEYGGDFFAHSIERAIVKEITKKGEIKLICNINLSYKLDISDRREEILESK